MYILNIALFYHHLKMYESCPLELNTQNELQVVKTTATSCDPMDNNQAYDV